MAKFRIEYNIHVGDIVVFNYNGAKRQGIVQDISQIPDIFVEVFDDNECRRWKLGIDSLEIVSSEYDKSGKYYYAEFEDNEPVEAIHYKNIPIY